MLAAASGGGDPPPDPSTGDEYLSAKPSRPLEIVTASVALGLALLALFLSRNIHLRMGGGGLDPKWWPTVLSSIAIGLSLILLGFSLFAQSVRRDDLESSHRDGWARMLSALALSAIYIFAWWTTGYLVATALYLVALLWLFGLRSWKGLVLFPLITTAFIYALFQLLLKVPL